MVSRMTTGGGHHTAIDELGVSELREILRDAAERHDDVAQAVRLAWACRAGNLGRLRTEVDSALRTRRFLGCRESSAWAAQAKPVLGAIGSAVASSPTADLIALIQRALGHVVKVILHADDSNGSIGDLARELLELHAEACRAGVAEPLGLAQWVFRFSVEDQDFFTIDPVRYAGALGELGLAWYRREVRKRLEAPRVQAVRPMAARSVRQGLDNPTPLPDPAT